MIKETLEGVFAHTFLRPVLFLLPVNSNRWKQVFRGWLTIFENDISNKAGKKKPRIFIKQLRIPQI